MTEKEGRPVVGDYILLSTLGEGSTGKVKLAEHKETGKKVAIKIIKKSDVAKNPEVEVKLRREIALMKVFDNPHLLRLVDVYETAGHILIILEYAEHGELFEYLTSRGSLAVEDGMRIFRQIIYGLEFLHHHAICHRDLKLENILLDQHDVVKIADFGLARCMKDNIAETSCGSPHYASPEVIKGQPYDGRKSDIWSAGVLLYVLLSGQLPFDDRSIRVLLLKVRKGVYKMPEFPPDIKNLVKRMMQVDPEKRITLQEIKEHEAFRRGLPEYYVCPSPLPIPLLTTPVDPASLSEDVVDVLVQLGFQDEEERNKQLESSEHTVVKAFVYMLTNKNIFEGLPWEQDESSRSSEFDDPMAVMELTFEGEDPMFGALGSASVSGPDPFYRRRPLMSGTAASVSSFEFNSVIEKSLLSDAQIDQVCENQKEFDVFVPLDPLMGSIILFLKKHGYAYFFPDEYKLLARNIAGNMDLLIEVTPKQNNELTLTVSSPKASETDFKALVDALEVSIDNIIP